MADVKIEENKYYLFLNTVKSYVNDTVENELDSNTKTNGEWLKNFIEKELEIRELMLVRKMNYDFYVKVKDTDSKSANQAYQNYIDAKIKIERLRNQ